MIRRSRTRLSFAKSGVQGDAHKFAITSTKTNPAQVTMQGQVETEMTTNRVAQALLPPLISLKKDAFAQAGVPVPQNLWPPGTIPWQSTISIVDNHSMAK